MQPTVYQKPEIRDANDNIIQQGAFGKNTALANATNDGWIDYVANDLEFLYDLAKDEIVPVPSLPASGQTNKTYLLTTTGVSYRWSGTEWVAVSSSEAVGRAESAALLAEQWATKTDGTVDGSEYSAKYYAQQAGQSADDAQDVADDMADHLVQIDKNTGGVAKNSKRISNIEKLLQGNLYDYDTDDDTAYVKTVPTGALPYAGVEKIGGKTLVWNQLNDNSATSKTTGNVTIIKDADNRTWTVNGASETNTTYNVSSAINYINGHKYLLKGCPSGGSNSTYRLVATNLLGANDEGNGVIVTCSADATGYLRVALFAGYEAINLAYTPQIHDLTLLYGAGNEPTTVEEFQQMFPADYYPYNAGTLLSAGVTEVVSKSSNLANGLDGRGYPSDTSLANNTNRIFTIGKYVVGLAYSNYYREVSVDSFSVTPTQIKVKSASVSAYGVGIPFNASDGEAFVVSYVGDTNGKVNVTWYTKDGAFISSVAISNTNQVVTAPANCSQGVIIFAPNAANTETTFSNYQVKKSSSVQPYSAPFIATMPIPTAIRSLEGYGWSAGNVYNYVDFERKVFVKRVGAVDLGTLTWTKNGANYRIYSSTVPNIQSPPDNNILANILCDFLPTVILARITVSHESGICVSGNGTTVNIGVGSNDDTVLDNLIASLSGKILYYELKTPIETDISQYLTDNLIEVGAGGMLTFPNANGDDYHIPVPSTETYMIDLQEAISNG